ncbi:MAG: hypothetical protein Q8M02_11825 [Candidatus Didemnitutus sp.]|nr:hypothetical protein [Candidatus Didemnitutus sp.]
MVPLMLDLGVAPSAMTNKKEGLLPMTWPFSEGITIALIGLVGVALAAVLPKWVERKKSKPARV